MFDGQEYVRSPWNLNNLPILKHSVLHYINAEISGMKVGTIIMFMKLPVYQLKKVRNITDDCFHCSSKIFCMRNQWVFLFLRSMISHIMDS